MHPEIETTGSIPEATGPGPTADDEGDAPAGEETAGDGVPTEEGAAAEATPSLDESLEALLFACEEPLTPLRLAQILGARRGEVLAGIDRLNVFYAESRRAFRIAPLAGGFQLVTTPEHAETLARLHKDKTASKLSRAALETLSIVAFKQPVTRAEVDAIRGVSASDGVIRHLMERNLVRIAGRAEAPGRPLLYGTTREFLAHFGLHAVGDLPRTDELAALLAGETRRPDSEEDDEAEIVASEGTPAPPGSPPRAAVVTSGTDAGASRPSWRDEHEADEDDPGDDELEARGAPPPPAGESDPDDPFPSTE